MKYKMTYQLMGCFSVVMFLFSVIVGSLFWVLFTWHTARIHEKDLEERATSIADTLSQFANREFQGQGRSGGYGAYLRFLDDIAMCEVWLADEHAQTIQMCQRNDSFSYGKLPSGAEDLIKQVFEGNTVVNREFSPMLEVPSITVGAPVYDIEGEVVTALLLHSPVEGISSAQRDGIVILIFCISVALLLAFLLSILLVRHFISPLKKIGLAAEKIMGGDYSARTEVKQNDEIGFLAENMDQLFVQLSKVEKEREKLDQMRQDFVSNISHELRTPVTVLKGSLEVLAEGLVTDPDEMQEYFQQMLSETVHLQRLVNDLLELSRLQNTNFQIEKVQLNLAEILQEAVRSMQMVSEQKKITIQWESRAGNIRFCGDYGRLRQMFLIVLDNAVKFSPPNQIVSVKSERRENQCVISV